MKDPTPALTAPQARALAALQHAAAGGSVTGTIRNGQGVNLRTMRTLEARGLCTITYGFNGGYVRRGRWIKPRPAWSAAATETAIRLRGNTETVRASG